MEPATSLFAAELQEQLQPTESSEEKGGKRPFWTQTQAEEVKLTQGPDEVPLEGMIKLSKL